MGLPRKLKAMAIFVNGVHYAGECTEVTPPTFERELEDYRAGGMGGRDLAAVAAKDGRATRQIRICFRPSA